MRALFTQKKNIGALGAKGRVLVLTSSNLLLQILASVYRMMLSRLAESEALGLQVLVMQVYSIMVSVCISGLNVAVMTTAARRNEREIERLMRAALTLFLMLFALSAAPIFLLRGAIAKSLIGDAQSALAIVLVLGCIFLTGIENLLKSVHIATGRVVVTAVSELTEQSVRYLLVFLLLKTAADGTDHRAVTLIILGMLMSEFFSVSFLSFSYRRNFLHKAAASKAGFKQEMLALCRVFVPAGFTSIAGTAFASAASLLLPTRLIAAGYTRSFALSTIGKLSNAIVPLVMLPMTFVGAVSAVALPAVSAAGTNTERIGTIAKKSFLAAAFALLAFNLPLIGVIKSVALTLFNTEPTTLCVLLLTIKAGIIYLQVTSTAVLNGMMQQKNVLVFALIGEASQLVLIHFLAALPSVHIYGYLASMCIGEGLRLVISMRHLKKLLTKKQTALAVSDR